MGKVWIVEILTRLMITGSFGKVYLAHHIMTRTKVNTISRCYGVTLQVVIKAAEKHETDGLAREIYHHRRLRHPHITKLYEVIHTEKNVWLVLEYCHGNFKILSND